MLKSNGESIKVRFKSFTCPLYEVRKVVSFKTMEFEIVRSLNTIIKACS